MFFVSALPPLMPGLPNCCRNFPSRVNFSSCASLSPLPASHTVSLLIDEDAVLDLRPVVAGARAAPRMHERARLVELEDRRRRNAAVGLRRRVAGAREPLVVPQRARPLHDVNVILPVDGHAADRADGPVFWQRLRERGVVFEDRNLNALRQRGPELAAQKGHADDASREASHSGNSLFHRAPHALCTAPRESTRIRLTL